MKLTQKQKDVVEKFEELQRKYGNKVFISGRFGNKARFMRLDDPEKMLVSMGGEFGEPINQRVLNGLLSKGLVKSIDVRFNYLTDKEVQESLYNKEIKFIGAVIAS